MTEDKPLPTPPEALMEALKIMGIPYILHTHKAVFTCEESDFLKDVIPGLHVKNLFLKDKKDKMALVVVPHALSLDLKAVAPVIGLDRISFGSPDRLWTYLGVRPGSVNPFCAMNDKEGKVEVILHHEVAEAPILSAHPMLNTMSLELSGPDLVSFPQKSKPPSKNH
jgi:Ala-tRNA(Pro) deacylase